MVFKELLSIWHDGSALSGIVRKFDEMLVESKNAFQMATRALEHHEDAIDDIGTAIKNIDVNINKLQRTIRREVVTHISVTGTGDMIPCLQLMSLTKDAERIGDYCKNIFEIISNAQDLSNDPLFPDAMDMKSKIAIWFEQTKRAFDRNDKELARNTRKEEFLFEKECDRIVWSLIKSDDKRNAVAMAMLIRFFKRIAAHLGNICTSVTQPLDRLDYFDKTDKEDLLSNECH